MILDAALIRRRRAELGLSARTVATHVKVSPNVIAAIEAGTNHDELSLAHLHRLADVLALEVTTLFAPAATDPTADPTSDAAQVGALLHATGVLTPLDALADALGWTAERLDTALAALDQTLSVAGLRLHHLRRAVTIVRAVEPVPPDVLAAVVRKHLNRNAISLSEGRLLYRYLVGDPPREPNNPERVATGVLVNAQLLAADPDDPARLTLTDDVRRSLLLDQGNGVRPTGTVRSPSSRRTGEVAP